MEEPPPLAGVIGSPGVSKDTPAQKRASYSIPGILHFIQHEWSRFEMERAQWEVERAELQAKIAFLQGERKGQENLKQDLVRRIKMLEYALKQERAKHYKLKYGSDMPDDFKDIQLPTIDSGSEDNAGDDPLGGFNKSNSIAWRQGRQLLRQYLQEIGYTDTILDVRSGRVRSLLGLSAGDNSLDIDNLENVLNGDNDVLPRSVQKDVSPLHFLKPAEMEPDNDEAEEEDNEVNEISSGEQTELREDVYNFGEPLNEFDAILTEVSKDNDVEATINDNGEWNVDQTIISKKKELYKKERKSKKMSQRPKRVVLEEIMCALKDAELEPSQPDGVAPPNAQQPIVLDTMDEMFEGPSAVRREGDSPLGLGDLAGLTITNEAEPYETSDSSKEEYRKSWEPKYTLRSHFDCIRALSFHPTELILVTASEDHTLKMWNLNKTVPTKKLTSTLDVEPVYTFRGHDDAVLCVAMSSVSDHCYSGGVDGTVRCWALPNSAVDPYDTYESSVVAGTYLGHDDSVWGVAAHPKRMHVLSCSADNTVRLWDQEAEVPLLSTIELDPNDGVPTSIDYLQCESNKAVVGLTSGTTQILDLETGKVISSLHVEPPQLANDDHCFSAAVNRVVSMATYPLVITGHEDRYIRFFDPNSGKLVSSMVAHLDAVTSVSIDPSGLYLMSGSHDTSIRLWTLNYKTCIQEITSHRKKYDESIFDVAFHPKIHCAASAGADGLAKVFM